jgi:hypothetical protein
MLTRAIGVIAIFALLAAVGAVLTRRCRLQLLK